jgi:hypothetical protein
MPQFYPRISFASRGFVELPRCFGERIPSARTGCFNIGVRLQWDTEISHAGIALPSHANCVLD